MKAKCHDCGELTDLEPFSGLCVDCLIKLAKREKQPEEKPFDYKKGIIYLTPLDIWRKILFMVNTLTVNGRTVAVLNALSCGPTSEPHTYELSGGAYVYEIAGCWWLQERGQSKREVTVGR